MIEKSVVTCAPILVLGRAEFAIQLAQRKAATTNPINPSPTPTLLDIAPAVGKEVVETAATEEVNVEVTTGPSPEMLGLDAETPPGEGELSPLGPFEGEEDAGGGMIVVAEAAEVMVVDGGDPVTAPVEAVLLSLSVLSVHRIVVAVSTMVDSEEDGAELKEDGTVTLCVNVVAVVVVEDEVAV